MFKIHSIFPFLKFFLGFIAFFAAGDGGFMSAFEGGGADSLPPDMSGDGDPGDETVDSAAEVTPGDGEPKEGDEVQPGDKKTAATEPAPDLTKPLSKEAKKSLSELKQINPAAWKEINARIWSLNGIDKKIEEHFDGGLDTAIKLKTDIDTFLQDAQADNLEDVRTELNDFRNTDAKIIKGDPTFLNDLPQEAQDALYKMMPSFVSDWRQRDEEGYQRYFGSLVVSTLDSTGFTKNLEMALWKLEDMGIDNADVKKIHDLLTGSRKWITELDTKVKAAPTVKTNAPVDDKVAAREKNVQAQELNLARGRVISRFRQTFDSKMLSSLKTIASGPDGKVPANVNRAEVLLRAMRNLAGTLGSQVESRIDQYLSGKNEEEAFKYLSSQVSDKRLNEAVTKAYRYLYGGPGTGTVRPTAKDKDGKDGAGAQPAAQGFVTINYNPKASSIDVAATTKLAQSMRLTYRQLISQSKGVLRNGKRVQWAHDAQDEA